jgi:hypothetical protein
MVLLLAGHGMGPKYQAQFLLEQILLGLKVAIPIQSIPETAPIKQSTLLGKTTPILKWGWQQLPDEIQFQLATLRNYVSKWADESPRPDKATIDSAMSLCFPVENNFSHGGIRINVIGREPNGKVSPGTEYDAFCKQLSHDLRELINIDTGKPVVNRVIRTAEMYKGPYLDNLPDLLVDWSNESPVSVIGSSKTGEICGSYTYRRTGDHKPGGLFTAVGPSLKSGRMERTVSVMDFAPTITRLLGVELSGIDGIPIAEIVDGV